MKYLFLFILFCSPVYGQSNAKADYDKYCKVCHKKAEVFFKGKLKTIDLYGTIKDMYKYQSGVNPSEKRLKDMYNYARSFKN